MKRWNRTLTAALLVKAACAVGLAALAAMAWPLFVPSTLPVLFSMSVGQGLGVVAFACYVGAILLEVRRHELVERALDEEAGHAANEVEETDRS
jgi:hypothetical protein